MTGYESKKYLLTIKTLTPLHIGSGSKLREDFDFFLHDGSVYFVNQGALYALLLDNLIKKLGEEKAGQSIRQISGKKISELIKFKHCSIDQLVDPQNRVVRNRISADAFLDKGLSQRELSVLLKSVENEPYLPGSSIKGSLRSSFFRFLNPDKIEINYRENRGRYDSRVADDILERKKFLARQNVSWREFPHYDIWRGVQITDTSTCKSDQIKLACASVYPLKESQNLDLYLEVIPEETTFQASLALDAWLFLEASNRGTQQGHQTGYSEEHLKSFREMPASIYEDSKELLRQEIRFIQHLQSEHRVDDIDQLRMTISHFDAIARMPVKPNEFITTMGFGTGWLAKTLGHHLQEQLSDEQFDEMVSRFELGRGNWKRNHVIPTTRMIVTTDTVERAPLGWVKVTMDEQL